MRLRLDAGTSPCRSLFEGASGRLLSFSSTIHNHDDNPPDGSNWELLCVYCHDNEHSRQTDHTGIGARDAEDAPAASTSTPFAGLASLLKNDG
ncbi:MAG: hypothetical protein GX761_07285 [Gammaproteobacteria bacterium]|nr:hypothetical protein [Gammaproteobacteria bacterium]